MHVCMYAFALSCFLQFNITAQWLNIFGRTILQVEAIDSDNEE